MPSFRSLLDRYIRDANPPLHFSPTCAFLAECRWLQRLKFPPEKIIEPWPNQEPKFNQFNPCRASLFTAGLWRLFIVVDSDSNWPHLIHAEDPCWDCRTSDLKEISSNYSCTCKLQAGLVELRRDVQRGAQQACISFGCHWIEGVNAKAAFIELQTGFHKHMKKYTGSGSIGAYFCINRVTKSYCIDPAYSVYMKIIIIYIWYHLV